MTSKSLPKHHDHQQDEKQLLIELVKKHIPCQDISNNWGKLTSDYQTSLLRQIEEKIKKSIHENVLEMKREQQKIPQEEQIVIKQRIKRIHKRNLIRLEEKLIETEPIIGVKKEIFQSIERQLNTFIARCDSLKYIMEQIIPESELDEYLKKFIILQRHIETCSFLLLEHLKKLLQKQLSFYKFLQLENLNHLHNMLLPEYEQQCNIRMKRVQEDFAEKQKLLMTEHELLEKEIFGRVWSCSIVF